MLDKGTDNHTENFTVLSVITINLFYTSNRLVDNSSDLYNNSVFEEKIAVCLINFFLPT